MIVGKIESTVERRQNYHSEHHNHSMSITDNSTFSGIFMKASSVARRSDKISSNKLDPISHQNSKKHSTSQIEDQPKQIPAKKKQKSSRR